MASLAELPDLVGFFSYSRRDDEHSDGALSRLRARIYSELRLQLGHEFRLWQDVAAIPEGALWEDEIKRAVSEAAFFVPIVTPSSVGSRHCRFEFEAFLKREAALGRSNLIFPLLYVRVPALEKEEQWRQDEVLSVIGARQYLDWQRLRHRSLADSEIAEKIEQYCANIVDALRQPWVSPEQRRAAEEAAAREVAEREQHRIVAEAHQADDERRRLEEARQRKVEEAQREAEAAAQRQVQQEAARRQAEAEARRRAEEEASRKKEEEHRVEAEARRLADEAPKRQPGKAEARTRVATRTLLLVAIGVALIAGLALLIFLINRQGTPETARSASNPSSGDPVVFAPDVGIGPVASKTLDDMKRPDAPAGILSRCTVIQTRLLGGDQLAIVVPNSPDDKAFAQFASYIALRTSSSYRNITYPVGATDFTPTISAALAAVSNVIFFCGPMVKQFVAQARSIGLVR